MGGKKKFIDKKKSATFQLLARDSSDPSYDVGPSGDRVFVRVDNNPFSIDGFDDENADNGYGNCADAPNSIFADAPEDEAGDLDFEDPKQLGMSPGAGASSLPDHVRREILELGFPDDGYNYLDHLREIKKTGGGSAFYHNSKAKLEQLPLDVKAYDASRVQITEVNDDPKEKAMYNVAAKTVGVRVQKAADAEVVALLDDSEMRFDNAEELEDYFVLQANVPEEGEDVFEDENLDLIHKLEVVKDKSNLSDVHTLDTVTDSRIADRIRYCLPDAGECDEKPRVQSLVDEQIELYEKNKYDTNGDGDCVGVSAEEYKSLAHKLTDVLKDHMMDDLELLGNYKVPADAPHDNELPNNMELLNSDADVIKRCIEYAEMYENENEDEDENVVVIQESSDESEAWDCETIISTYSNLDNHPGKIEAPETTRKKKLADTLSKALGATSPIIALRGKEKLPVDFLPGTRKVAKEKEKSAGGLKTQPQERKQHGKESKEEKKERKAAVKNERREARRVKKEVKSLFKSEAQHALKVAAISCPSSIRLM